MTSGMKAWVVHKPLLSLNGENYGKENIMTQKMLLRAKSKWKEFKKAHKNSELTSLSENGEF